MTVEERLVKRITELQTYVDKVVKEAQAEIDKCNIVIGELKHLLEQETAVVPAQAEMEIIDDKPTTN